MDNEKESWADRFDRYCEKQTKREAKLVFNIFLLHCSLLFSAGILGNFLITQAQYKLLFSGIFFCFVRYFSRNKLNGGVVYGGMYKPWAVSFGATLLLVGWMFTSKQMEHLLFPVICVLLGFYFFHKGFKAGPHCGWDHYLRCQRG